MSTETTNQGQLGTIVSWRVPSMVSLSALRDALVDAELSADLAGDMQTRNALKRGMRDMKQGRVIRQLRVEGELLYFQFTAEHFDELEITYDKEAELTLNLQTGEIKCDVQALAVQADQLMNEHLAKRLTSDMTRLVQRVYDANRADLIPIREAGGAYFVPDMHREIVVKTRKLLNAIGGKLLSFDVRLGSSDTSASVADSLSDYLSDLIGEFRESCEAITSESKSRSTDARKANLAELRQKLECYSGLLGGYASGIQAQIATADQELLQAMLREPTPEPEAPAEGDASAASEPTETAVEAEPALA